MTNLDSASFSSGNLPKQIAILIPQGAEHQAVLRGLKKIKADFIQVVAIPLGVNPVTEFLANWQPDPDIQGILVMGLAGAVSARLTLGQVVVYQSCSDGEGIRKTDLAWSQHLSQCLDAPLINAYTSPELVSNTQAKADLQQKTGAAVVDMEGGPILAFGARFNIPVAMVRVISDTANQDLPDLSKAIGVDGSLNPFLLTWAFLQKPFAAGHLIAGSLRGLGSLEEIPKKLFQTYSYFCQK